MKCGIFEKGPERSFLNARFTNILRLLRGIEKRTSQLNFCRASRTRSSVPYDAAKNLILQKIMIILLIYVPCVKPKFSYFLAALLAVAGCSESRILWGFTICLASKILVALRRKMPRQNTPSSFIITQPTRIILDRILFFRQKIGSVVRYLPHFHENKSPVCV